MKPIAYLITVLLALPLLPAWAAPAAPAAPAGRAPRIRITIDDTAVRQLIALIQAKDTQDADVEKWLDLPANQCLLRVGAEENDLTRAQLKANVLAVIQGTATAASQPPDSIGCVRVDPVADYAHMLDDLHATLPDRVARIVARDTAFSPPGTDVSENVYLHLGGDWDAINRDGAIYINIRFWHDNFRPGWDGLNLIIAHETLHTIQNQAYGNPEVQDNADGAFLTALSKIQREGTARYVEYDTDPGPYAPYTYGFFTRATDSERLRAFPSDLALLERLYQACYPQWDHERFVQEFSAGVDSGGPYYDIGHGIAKAIDEKMGRAALIRTIQKGPKAFFLAYLSLRARHPTLPALPPDVARQVRQMKARL